MTLGIYDNVGLCAKYHELYPILALEWKESGFYTKHDDTDNDLFVHVIYCLYFFVIYVCLVLVREWVYTTAQPIDCVGISEFYLYNLLGSQLAGQLVTNASCI